MNKQQARIAIASQFGAEVLRVYDHMHAVVRFRNGKADLCKEVLDAIDPGFTGEIFADNRLLIAWPELARPKET